MARWEPAKTAGAARSMASNRPTGTAPEELLFAAIELAGATRPRRNCDGLDGRPDGYWDKARVAVFMHGCYWHSCPSCYPEGAAGRLTGRDNAELWRQKWLRNERRDAEVAAGLESDGVTVVVVWECQIKDGDGLLAWSLSIAELVRENERLAEENSHAG